MLEFILKLDYWLFSQINYVFTHPLADIFFVWITDLHKTSNFKFVAIPLVFFFYFKKYKRQGITYFIFLILALSVSDFVGGKVKHLFERPRPVNNADVSVQQRTSAGSYAFYSNHTSNMFTFASYTSIFFPVMKVPLFALAAAVAYSRVYNGVHYPSDVIAGAIIGLLWASIFIYLVKKVIDWNVARKVEP
jgi:undecaprenyl-diphosphatase